MRGWHAVQQHSSIVLLVLTVGSYMALLLWKNLLQLQVYLLNRLLGLFMYGCRKDFIDWSEYLYAQSKWPSVFPIHSVRLSCNLGFGACCLKKAGGEQENSSNDYRDSDRLVEFGEPDPSIMSGYLQ